MDKNITQWTYQWASKKIISQWVPNHRAADWSGTKLYIPRFRRSTFGTWGLSPGFLSRRSDGLELTDWFVAWSSRRVWMFQTWL